MRAAPLLLTLLAAGIIAGLPPLHAALSFTLVESTPRVVSLDQFHSQLIGDWNQECLTDIRSATWELRDVSHRLVGRIPVRFWHGDNGGRKVSRTPVAAGGPGFTADELRHLGPTGAGDFQLALIVNGVRSSNVVAFTIDPRYDPSVEPVLQVGKIEPAPGQKLGWLAWWATGPKYQDPRLTNMDVAGPAIWVDGRQVRPQGVGAWAGPVGPVPAGQTEVGTCTAKELVGIDPTRPHDFHVVVDEGKNMFMPSTYASSKLNIYASQPVRLNLSDAPLARAWDAATPTLGPAPPAPVPLLAGRVLDVKNEPAVGWLVRLEQNDWPGMTEIVDADGYYSFPGVAPGIYTLVASRTNRTPTHLDFSNVTLVANETRHLGLSWNPPYSFIGSVTDAQGHPRNHIEVAAEWKDDLTGATCTTTDFTWRDGSYTLAGPFPDIVSVSVLGSQAPPDRHDVKPGDRHVDFALPTR